MNALDLFCGCGGMSHGLRQCGVNIEWANEKWEAAADTYSSMHPDVKIYRGDSSNMLSLIQAESPGMPSKNQFDLIVGGPPCQGFSGWNRYRDISDQRNSQVDVFLSFVSFLRPSFVIMENVTGILSLDNGRAARSILESYSQMGYTSKIFILQAGSFGLPQNRWRVFFVAAKGTKKIPDAIPTHEFPRTAPFNTTAFKDSVVRPTSPDKNTLKFFKKHLTVADAIDDLPAIPNGGKFEGSYPTQPNSPFQNGLRLESRRITNHQTFKLGPAYMNRINLLGPGASWVDLPHEMQPANLQRGGKSYDNRFGRLKWDGIFNTIVSKPEPYWGRYIHPNQNRVLSVRECARAQSIPDTFNFSGNLKEQYLQVGNAVPPILSKFLGNLLQQIL
jgi:DNA (cytosine-5)-methyltransferase 1